MVTMEALRQKYYTPEGIDALSTRLKTIYGIYLQTPSDMYPLTFQMLGFPPLVLETKEECLGHINELRQSLMVEVGETSGDAV